MAGLVRARQAMGRFCGGAWTAVRAAASATGDRLRRCRFAAWVEDYLEAARRRNDQAAIEETKTCLRAKRRSLALMLSLLSAEQREEFRNYRYFHAIGGRTGIRYRIRVASFANIDIVGSNGRTMCRLCAHPAGDVPVYDVMAAQMLHLEDAATERAFLRSANLHPATSAHERRQGWALRVL